MDSGKSVQQLVGFAGTIQNFKDNHPDAARRMGKAYGVVSGFVAPVQTKVSDLWKRFGPAIPPEGIAKAAFYFGSRHEKDNWSYVQTDTGAESLVRSAIKSMLTRTVSREPSTDAPVDLPRDVQQLFANAKREFVAEKTHAQAPLNEIVMEIYRAGGEVYSKWRNPQAKDQGEVQRATTALERACIQAGRAKVRRGEHFDHNLSHAVRWAILWYAMGATHSWARNIGFAGGSILAFVSNTEIRKDPAKNKSNRDKLQAFHGLNGWIREAINYDLRLLGSITTAWAGLALWKALRFPGLDLVTAPATAVLGATAGHYCFSPIVGIKKEGESALSK